MDWYKEIDARGRAARAAAFETQINAGLTPDPNLLEPPERAAYASPAMTSGGPVPLYRLLAESRAAEAAREARRANEKNMLAAIKISSGSPQDYENWDEVASTDGNPNRLKPKAGPRSYPAAEVTFSDGKTIAGVMVGSRFRTREELENAGKPKAAPAKRTPEQVQADKYYTEVMRDYRKARAREAAAQAALDGLSAQKPAEIDLGDAALTAAARVATGRDRAKTEMELKGELARAKAERTIAEGDLRRVASDLGRALPPGLSSEAATGDQDGTPGAADVSSAGAPAASDGGPRYSELAGTRIQDSRGMLGWLTDVGLAIRNKEITRQQAEALLMLRIGNDQAIDAIKATWDSRGLK
jgi:hypothetical protein